MDRSQHKEIENWFISRGVPHFITDYSARTDIWTRALPFLIVAYLAGGLNALNLAEWSLGRNLVAAGITLTSLVLGWSLTNLVLNRPFLAIPKEIGKPELIAFVIGPAIPSALFQQWGDSIQALLEGLAILGIIYVAASFALGHLLSWALRNSISQAAMLGRLLVRALPLLLLFTTFLFINAEVWQVAGQLSGIPYLLGVGIFFLLGAVFVLSRIPHSIAGLTKFESWSDIQTLIVDTPAEGLELPETGTPPQEFSTSEKIDLALVTTFNQSVQITFVALVLTLFFIIFGFLAISLDTQSAWMMTDQSHVFFTWTVSSRNLVVTESLLRVAGFLGAFIGMYFTVVLSTDETYRSEFAEDTSPLALKALAVRLAYKNAHGS
jgi:hypothetical protein